MASFEVTTEGSGAEVVQAAHRPYSGGSCEVRTYIVAFLQTPNCSERRG
jgi:hypothetical protein